MKLFEYMGKELFDKYNIPVPKGGVAGTPEEAAKQAENLEEAVVKSQILSGKRGKAGGIKFVSGKEHARQAADELLGMELKGLKVEKVLVEEKLPIEKEFYLAITLDGTLKNPLSWLPLKVEWILRMCRKKKWFVIQSTPILVCSHIWEKI